ncbi:hypothetical protein F1559_003939 [Cyanidiococcus yangmingshanensis]|uniref:Endoplasmic reticulum membrane protein n=1 Tax=Cyanidiococcus yangmingshanensis TaxID=2690220 RepID=A0A7J7II83_9RHOD|nr:hypothetical protein F1559_003939 [Cyanidiococcus yangmingshanensis]
MKPSSKHVKFAHLSLDFSSQYRFYLEYHSNPGNQLVHVLFVPLLLGSALAALSLWSFQVSFFGKKLLVDAGMILASLLGFAAALLWVLPLYVVAKAVTLYASSGRVLWYAVAAVQASGWSAQFAAHHWLEKRRPALLDNMVQAFASAPFFVFLEVLAALGLDGGVRKHLQRPKSPRRTKTERGTSTARAKTYTEGTPSAHG